MSVAVMNAVARFFEAIDERRWDEATSLMTSPIHIDYSSFGAGDPSDVRPGEIIGQWKALLPGFDATHHQLGNPNLDVHDDRADLKCYVMGAHTIGQEVWLVVGRYEIELERSENGWQVSSLRFIYRYQTGPRDLPERATKRAATR